VIFFKEMCIVEDNFVGADHNKLALDKQNKSI